MNKAKILRLLEDADDIVSALYRQGANKDYKCKSLREKLKAIETEITAPPKSNGDCIRNMTDDEELLIAIGIGCYRCAYINGECDRGYGKRCIDGNLEWLKQEVSEDAGTDD